MKIQVKDIKAAPKEEVFLEYAGELNAILARGIREYEVVDAIHVQLTHYRTGGDLFFSGELRGALVGVCARCLEEYPFRAARTFSFVLAPMTPVQREAELTRDDLSLSFYGGEEIDLSPFVREQMLLALPMRPLCRQECRGLCPRCGVNLNKEKCECGRDAGDARLSMLRAIKIPL